MVITAKSVKFWFTHDVNFYEIKEIHNNNLKNYSIKKVKRTGKIVRLDWDNCTMDIAGKITKDELRIILRSTTMKNSEYRGNMTVGIRYMLGIDIKRVDPIKIEDYALSNDNYNVRENLDIPLEKNKKKQRIGFQLDGDGNRKFWIWDWYDGKDVENCGIYEVYRYIKLSIDSSELLEKGLFDLGVSKDEINEKITQKKIPVIPVIYQPALDSLKNYVRQIHCAHTGPNIWEVSIIFNNEVLRRHKILNFAYEKLRLLMYHRVADIETLKICMDDQQPNKNNKHFVFENIFSKDFEIEYDSAHFDPHPALHRNIKYLSSNYFNPVIFINTSNHAMSGSDNNHDLWKWEYVPYLKNSPTIFGTKSRKELNLEFSFLNIVKMFLSLNFKKIFSFFLRENK